MAGIVVLSSRIGVHLWGSVMPRPAFSRSLRGCYGGLVTWHGSGSCCGALCGGSLTRGGHGSRHVSTGMRRRELLLADRRRESFLPAQGEWTLLRAPLCAPCVARVVHCGTAGLNGVGGHALGSHSLGRAFVFLCFYASLCLQPRTAWVDS